ncbi:MAG: hypothetical protein R2831_02095 [Chitinophagaceae bacterium]
MKKILYSVLLLMLTTAVTQAQVDVSGAVTGNGTYPTLGAAITAIGTAQTGANIVVDITANTTEAATTIVIGAGDWASMTIKPSGGAYTITAATTAGAPMIDLSGADNVTINGLNSGGNALTIANTTISATSGTSTIRFIGDATSNTITNCTIQGSATVPVGTNGGNIYFATGTTTGNDNNTISNCKITAAGTNYPSKGIYLNGTTTSTAIENSNITITNNEIYDFFLSASSAGIYVATGNTQISITNNKLYQTTTKTFTASGTMYGIYCSNTGTTALGENFTITGNTVGYANASGTGTYTLTGAVSVTFYGIYHGASSATTSPSNLNNNIISDISITQTTGSVYGIASVSSTGAANTININDNVIKNFTLLTATGTQYGISWGSGFNVNILNNSIHDFTRNTSGTMYGIYSGSSSSNENVSNNSVYNFSITATTASSPTVRGISQGTLTNGTSKIFSNNQIYNFTTNTTSSAVFDGVYVGYCLAVGNTIVSNNTVHDITGNWATAYGVRVGNNGGVSIHVFKNKIYNVSGALANSAIYGIYHSANTAYIYNNLVGDLNASISSLTAPAPSVVGVYSLAGTCGVYNNTINLACTSTGANFGTAGVYANTATSFTMANNAIINNSTPNGTGYTIAYQRSSTTITSYNNNSNRNCYYAGFPSATNLLFFDGTNAIQTTAALATFMATRDGSSFSENPSFSSLVGANSDYLHIPNASVTQLESGGQNITTPLISDDYDGHIRFGNTGYPGGSAGFPSNGTAPDVGADEFEGSSPAPGLVLNSVTPTLTSQCVASQRDIIVDATSVLGVITDVTLYYSYNGVAQTPVTLNFMGGDSYFGSIPAATSPANATVAWYVVATNSIPLSTTYTGQSYSDEPLTGSSVSASASPATVCAGQASTLMANVSVPNQTKIVGAGATTSATYSNPFYSLWSNTHNQHLILASELQAAGLSAGNITSLGIDVTVNGTLPMINLSVAMANTSATSMASYVSPTFTTVYTNASLMPTVGVNMLSFSTPFVWDGVSNVVIDFCHDNMTSTATMSRTCKMDNTSYISTIHVNRTSTTGVSICGNTATNLLTYSARPQFYFIGNGSLPLSAISWSDGTNTVGSTNPLVVNPLATTTYTATIDALGCPVALSPSTTVTALPVPSTPSVTNSTQCGVGIPTASVASTAGSAGNGQFSWYDASTNGNLIQAPPFSNVLNTYYYNDFSSTTLINSSIYGNASIVGGLLNLTPNATSQAGAIVVNASGYPSSMYQIDFDASNGPAGTSGIADGFSYSFCNDGSATGTTPTPAELGTGTKLRIGFDTYGAGVSSAGIYLIYGTTISGPGQTVGTNGILAYSANTSWVNTSNTHVSISINDLGQVSVSVAGNPIFTNVQLPAGFLSADRSSWTHFIKARSGGIAGQFDIDNLEIKLNQQTTGSTTWLNAISSTQNFYVSEMGTNGCASDRALVTATVTNPPALTLTGTKTICNNSVQQLDVTSNLVDFDTYIWSPATDLYTDAGATIPYDGVSSATTLYYKSGTAGSHVITVNSNNTTSGCLNVATTTMQVLPAAITVSASQPNLCVSGNTVLSFTPTTNLFNASLQWSESPTSSSYTNISGANALTYAVTGLSATNYYQMTITDDNSAVCLMNSTAVNVNNPQLLSSTPGSRCGLGTVDLSATANAGSTINWYNAASGGTLLGSGATFTTPSIASTTTYYAAAAAPGSTNINGGKPNTNGADGTNTTGGIYFTANQAFTLNSVKMYPTAAGTNTIVLYSGSTTSGTAIYTATYTFTGANSAGVNVPLGWSIAPGSYTIYQSTSGASCWRDFSGGSSLPTTAYPYTIGSACTLTDGTLAGYYYFFYDWNIAIGCESTRVPVTASVIAPPTITASSPASICLLENTSLTATSALNPNYTYTWNPGALSGANQTVSPVATTTYTVNAVDNTTGTYAGCATAATVTVTVKPLPSFTSSASSTSLPCGGSSILTASANTTYISGTGSVLNSASGITPYSHFYEGQRTQYLYTAAELQAQSISAGSIVSLTYNVTAKNSTTNTYNTAGDYKGYTIKMAHTTATDLASADATGSFTTVYGPTNYTTAVGPNTHTFSTPFTWDGVSNIVVQVCFENDPTSGGIAYTNNDEVASTATTITSVRGYYQDNSSTCSNSTGTLATSTSRPNTTFTALGISNYEWNPGAFSGSSYTVMPTANTTYTVTATSVNGCTATQSHAITVAPCTATLNITAFIQGFYAGTSTMQATLVNQGVSTNPTDCDSVTVELHNATSPYATAHSFTGVLQTNGTLACTFPPAAVGNSYYIVLNHRNSVQTWSAAPVAISTVGSYMFSTAATQAYGSNEVDAFTDGVYSMYNGDINQDGFIDIFDFLDWDVDNQNFNSGYYATDLNGDSFVDIFDFLVWDPNNQSFIGIITP